jgi:hypothetical protein
MTLGEVVSIQALMPLLFATLGVALLPLRHGPIIALLGLERVPQWPARWAARARNSQTAGTPLPGATEDGR